MSYAAEFPRYADRLRDFDLRVDVPGPEEPKQIQRIQSVLSKGERRATVRILKRYSSGTPGPEASSSMTFLNPIEWQCEEAFDYAAGECNGRHNPYCR